LIEASIYSREEMSVVLSNRSATYMALGCYVEALCDADAIVGLKKGWPKGHFRKGKALMALGELQEARDAYIFGLDFEPGEKDLVAALEECEQAIASKAEAKRLGDSSSRSDATAT